MANQTTSDHADRMGLGLSGGGLRASFYHIGILAQMADQGLLRHLEVISTVSGGSIIGALYYLHVKKLLESKPDAEISDQDYVELVGKIETEFFKATEKNIRMATFSSFAKNWRMVYFNYSRSDRIGELYNDWLYQNVIQDLGNPVQMQKLKIYPPDGPSDFSPNHHNADRSAKVPILVVNATSLNTGRVWQYTARTMGEPPVNGEPSTSNQSSDDLSAHQIDKKTIRLRRANAYADITPLQQDFPLGHAVASSACVPALFDPMTISSLYYDPPKKKNDTEKKLKQHEIRTELVDGGVYDNQGVDSLIDNDCTCFIVSDASGQMDMVKQLDTGPTSVLLRVTSILQDRVRSDGLLRLAASYGSNNIAFLSLRKGLGFRKVHWVDKSDTQSPDVVIPATSLQEFDVHPDVQESLSKIRTDLDAFTEVEAYSLMFDAYKMSQDDLQKFKNESGCQYFKQKEAEEKLSSPWKFLAIAHWMKEPTKDYLDQLDVAQSTFGKALKCMPLLWAPLLVFIGLVLYFFTPLIISILSSSISIYSIIVLVAVWLISNMVPKLARVYKIFKVLRSPALMVKSIYRVAGLLMATLFIKFYLRFINPLYLKQGRISKLK